MPAGGQLGAHSTSSRPLTFYQKTIAVGSSGAQLEKQGSPELLAGMGAGQNPVLLLHNLHSALVCWVFCPLKTAPPAASVFLWSCSPWLTAAVLDLHSLQWGCSRWQEREARAIATAALYFLLFILVFFPCLFALNRSCNAQLKEACQGKAKTNGVHCFDLLFSLEKGHGPILPGFFLLYLVLPL